MAENPNDPGPYRIAGFELVGDPNVTIAPLDQELVILFPLLLEAKHSLITEMKRGNPKCYLHGIRKQF